MSSVSRQVRWGAAVAMASGLALAGCGSSAESGNSSAPTPAKSAAASSNSSTSESDRKEVRTLVPRMVIAYDGGLLTIDESGQLLASTPKAGFLRVNPAGDGRHVMISDDSGFQVFDAGVQAEPHGDHFHFYASTPQLTKVAFPAKKPGHVVVHEGQTTLFADGTGDVVTVNSAQVADPAANQAKFKTSAPHHGVAMMTQSGGILSTQGTEDKRTTVQYVVGGSVKAQTTDCPGVHGEAAAKPGATGDIAVFGCENGPVVFRDGTFHKVKAAARSGTLAGSHTSPIVLADHKIGGKESKEKPTRIALIDSRTDSMKVLDLGSAYWFRSLARGPHGEGVVLTGNGNLNIVDVDHAKVSKTIAVVKPWTEGENWQDAGPLVKVAGTKAYVTDAAAKQVVIVDLEHGKVERRIPLKVTPVELAVASGYADGKEPHNHDHADDHEHHDGDGHTHSH